MSKSVEEIASIATNWWANAISNPKFDKGDSSYIGLMCSALASRAVSYISEDKK